MLKSTANGLHPKTPTPLTITLYFEYRNMVSYVWAGMNSFSYSMPFMPQTKFLDEDLQTETYKYYIE